MGRVQETWGQLGKKLQMFFCSSFAVVYDITVAQVVVFIILIVVTWDGVDSGG